MTATLPKQVDVMKGFHKVATLPRYMLYCGFQVEVMCGSDGWWMVRYTEDSGEFTTKPFVVKTDALDREPEKVDE